VLAHLLLRGDDLRKSTLPGLQDRIFLVPLVKGDRAVVCVHGRLHRVADVVDLVATERTDLLHRTVGEGVGDRLVEVDPVGVRAVVRGGVGVDDPHQAAVDDRRVGAAVRGQERGDLVHPVQRVTLVDDPGVLGDRTVEQDARLLVLDRVQDTAEEVAQRDATLTVVTVVGLRTLFFTLGAFLGTFLLGLGTLLGTFGVRLVRGQCLVGVRGRTGLWVGRVLRGRYVPGLVLGVEGVVVLLLGLDDDVVGPLASVVDPWFVLAGDLTEFTPRRDIVLGED